ncbi:MAG: phosphoribosylglycinamide formyltransferase [Kiritimatiellia bacterium]|nr:phosphoribosylglycinamide formyltransferase [Kiritimatiellia bacterium]
MLDLAVIGSGKGSNFQSILDAVQAGRLSARIRCVLSDHPDAFILERARRAGIPAEFIDSSPYKTKLEGEGEERMLGALRRHGADFIALAGFMRIIKPGLLSAYGGRIVNLHPSLLPAFPGLHAWEQALAYGVKTCGCTVHFVDEGTDTGPIVAQRAVPVLDDDTSETLHARIQEQEHIVYPIALQWIAEGRVIRDGRRVRIRP